METVHVTGNTVVDAVNWVGPQIESGASAEVRDWCTACRSKSKLLLVTTHRRESFGKVLGTPAEPYAASPRVRRRPGRSRDASEPPYARARSGTPRRSSGHHPDRPGGLFFSLLFLMFHSHFILTDLGGIQEEAPAFGKPVLVCSEVTERPEAVQAGCARIVGTEEKPSSKEASRLIEDPVTIQIDGR